MNRHLHVVDSNQAGSVSGTSARTSPNRAKLAPALQMLRSRCETLLSDRLEAVFEHVDDTFFDLADHAENNQQQTVYFDAMRVLRMNRKTIESSCLQAFHGAFRESHLTSLLVAAEQGIDADVDSMELLENDELEQKVAFEVMIRRSDEHCKRGLQILCKRLDSLYDCAINTVNNPLGPEAICRAFRCATEKIELDIRSRLVFLKLFERHVLSSLPEFVQQANQLLKELGVLPNIEMLKKRGGDAGRKYNNAGKTTQAYGGEGAGSGLIAQLSAMLAQQQSTAGDQTFAVRDDVLSALNHLQTTGFEDGGLTDLAEPGEDGGSLLEAIGRQLAMQQQPAQISLADKTVFTLVELLFRQAYQSKAVSPVMGSTMKALELAIAKIALQDANFFDSAEHPARQLLNEVAQASMGFGDSDEASNDPVYKKIHEIVDQLQQSDVDSEQLPQLLDDFVSFVGREQRRSKAVESRLLEEEDGRVRLNTSHTIVKQTVEKKLLGKNLPKIVVSFVEQGWGKVMFLAHLREGELSSPWNDSLKVLDEILSFAMPRGQVSEQLDQEKLIEEMQLQLEKAALDPYQIDFLLNGIKKLIDLRITRREKGKPDPNLKAVEVATVLLNIPGEPCDLQEQSSKQAVETKYLKQVDTLENGDWVELITGDDVSRRARFAGTVGPAETMVFVNSRGVKVIEGSRQQLALALKKQRLVLLDKAPVFDRAMEDVVRNIQDNFQQSRDIA